MDARGWAAWLAIGISLLWNAINTYRSIREAKRSHRVTEFKELKGPVDTELRGLRRTKNEITSLALTAETDQEFVDSAGELNRELSKKAVDLSVALETLDKSNHSDGTNWTESASIEWDAVFEEYDGLYATGELTERKQKISEVLAKLDALIDGVQKLLENELELKAAGPSWHLDFPLLKQGSEKVALIRKQQFPVLVQKSKVGWADLIRRLGIAVQWAKRLLEDWRR
ncbi:MAG: hypothetical protein JJ866_24860 [Roseibium sp.]|uniref:hypothetical protein n=1 Tax=Roseibium sp. TaxID=1936156 RepID=UPI001B22DF6E|nr:hypothetical protein [Roseibium sp.]MBO6895190.1 hypothetical protein [Roseibium sp.]